jgi:hypothetical protein
MGREVTALIDDGDRSFPHPWRREAALRELVGQHQPEGAEGLTLALSPRTPTCHAPRKRGIQ